jgi:hypothetical protein
MGYNIELSFNILKNGSTTEILNKVRTFAENNYCDNFYDNFEFENKAQFQRNHCLITVNFSQERINHMVEFLNNVKKDNIYVESIYDDKNNSIIYASQYFVTQKMDKNSAKEYRITRRNRSYSDDEISILNVVSKKF